MRNLGLAVATCAKKWTVRSRCVRVRRDGACRSLAVLHGRRSVGPPQSPPTGASCHAARCPRLHRQNALHERRSPRRRQHRQVECSAAAVAAAGRPLSATFI